MVEFHPTVSQINRVFWLATACEPLEVHILKFSVATMAITDNRGINHAHYKTYKICIELEKSLMAPCYDVGFIAEKKNKNY